MQQLYAVISAIHQNVIKESYLFKNIYYYVDLCGSWTFFTKLGVK